MILGIKSEADDRLVRLLCRSALDEFGSVGEFVQCWSEHVRHAQQAGRPLKTVLDTFLAIACMVEAAQTPQPPVEDMTDEDIERTLAVEIEHLIREQPEIAIRAARRLGWRIERFAE